jgi:hypothetical protein
VEGYEHQEIAELLDCSVGNSKSQLHKAKLRIRELLGRSREEADAAAARPRPRTRKTDNRWDRDALSVTLPRPAFVEQYTATGV